MMEFGLRVVTAKYDIISLWHFSFPLGASWLWRFFLYDMQDLRLGFSHVIGISTWVDVLNDIWNFDMSFLPCQPLFHIIVGMLLSCNHFLVLRL